MKDEDEELIEGVKEERNSISLSKQLKKFSFLFLSDLLRCSLSSVHITEHFPCFLIQGFWGNEEKQFFQFFVSSTEFRLIRTRKFLEHGSIVDQRIFWERKQFITRSGHVRESLLV